MSMTRARLRSTTTLTTLTTTLVGLLFLVCSCSSPLLVTSTRNITRGSGAGDSPLRDAILALLDVSNAFTADSSSSPPTDPDNAHFSSHPFHTLAAIDESAKSLDAAEMLESITSPVRLWSLNADLVMSAMLHPVHTSVRLFDALSNVRDGRDPARDTLRAYESESDATANDDPAADNLANAHHDDKHPAALIAATTPTATAPTASALLQQTPPVITLSLNATVFNLTDFDAFLYVTATCTGCTATMNVTTTWTLLPRAPQTSVPIDFPFTYGTHMFDLDLDSSWPAATGAPPSFPTVDAAFAPFRIPLARTNRTNRATRTTTLRFSGYAYDELPNGKQTIVAVYIRTDMAEVSIVPKPCGLGQPITLDPPSSLPAPLPNATTMCWCPYDYTGAYCSVPRPARCTVSLAQPAANTCPRSDAVQDPAVPAARTPLTDSLRYNAALNGDAPCAVLDARSTQVGVTMSCAFVLSSSLAGNTSLGGVLEGADDPTAYASLVQAGWALRGGVLPRFDYWVVQRVAGSSSSSSGSSDSSDSSDSSVSSVSDDDSSLPSTFAISPVLNATVSYNIANLVVLSDSSKNMSLPLAPHHINSSIPHAYTMPLDASKGVTGLPTNMRRGGRVLLQFRVATNESYHYVLSTAPALQPSFDTARYLLEDTTFRTPSYRAPPLRRIYVILISLFVSGVVVAIVYHAYKKWQAFSTERLVRQAQQSSGSAQLYVSNE